MTSSSGEALEGEAELTAHTAESAASSDAASSAVETPGTKSAASLASAVSALRLSPVSLHPLHPTFALRTAAGSEQPSAEPTALLSSSGESSRGSSGGVSRQPGRKTSSSLQAPLPLRVGRGTLEAQTDAPRWVLSVHRDFFFVTVNPALWLSALRLGRSSLPALFIDRRSASMEQRLLSQEVLARALRSSGEEEVAAEHKPARLSSLSPPASQTAQPALAAQRSAACWERPSAKGEETAGERALEEEVASQLSLQLGPVHARLLVEALLGTLFIGGLRFLAVVSEAETVASFSDLLDGPDRREVRRSVKRVRRALCVPYKPNKKQMPQRSAEAGRAAPSKAGEGSSSRRAQRNSKLGSASSSRAKTAAPFKGASQASVGGEELREETSAAEEVSSAAWLTPEFDLLDLGAEDRDASDSTSSREPFGGEARFENRPSRTASAASSNGLQQTVEKETAEASAASLAGGLGGLVDSFFNEAGASTLSGWVQTQQQFLQRRTESLLSKTPLSRLLLEGESWPQDAEAQTPEAALAEFPSEMHDREHRDAISAKGNSEETAAAPSPDFSALFFSSQLRQPKQPQQRRAGGRGDWLATTSASDNCHDGAGLQLVESGASQQRLSAGVLGSAAGPLETAEVSGDFPREESVSSSGSDGEERARELEATRYACAVAKYLSVCFYFSHSLDLTQTLQRQTERGFAGRLPDFPGFAESARGAWKGFSLLEAADERFAWNALLLEDWRAAQVDARWLTPVIQGYVGYVRLEQRRLNSLSKQALSLELLLLSRRSRRRGGTRYNARGIDDSGNVANFVESEQRVRLLSFEAASPASATAAASRALHSARWASMVQIRGSIPLFWEQTGLTAQTALTRNAILTLSAFEKHQMTLAHRYGPRVVYVDLLSGVRDSEAKLVNALEEVLRAFAAERRDFPPVKHIHYDFHAQVKSKLFEAALGDFVQRALLEEAASIGFFLPPSPAGEQASSTEDGSCCAFKGPARKQMGVLRTNCLDCLDRTNVFQWFFCWFWLKQLLRQNRLDDFLIPVPAKNIATLAHAPLGAGLFRSCAGERSAVSLCVVMGGVSEGSASEGSAASDLLRQGSHAWRAGERLAAGRPSGGSSASSPRIESDSVVLRDVVKQLWADQGDNISLLYTGTGSVFSSHIKQGNRHSFSNNLDHALKSIGRFYQNTFEDTFRQECVDILQGRHKLSRGSCALPPKLKVRRSLGRLSSFAKQISQQQGGAGDCDEASLSGLARQSSQQPHLVSAAQTAGGKSVRALRRSPLSLESRRLANAATASTHSVLAEFPGEAFRTCGFSGDGESAVERPPSQRGALQQGGDFAESQERSDGSFQIPLRVWMGSWNVAGRELREWDELEDWLLPSREQADVYVFCVQELVRQIQLRHALADTDKQTEREKRSALCACELRVPQVELTGLRVLMNLRDRDKEARLEAKTAAGLHWVSCSAPPPAFVESRAPTLQALLKTRQKILRRSTAGASPLHWTSSAASMEAERRDCSFPTDATEGFFEESDFDFHSACDESEATLQETRSDAPVFVKVRSVLMVGLWIGVYVRADLRHFLTGVEVTSVKVGMKGNAGNKGAVGVRLCLGGCSFCFLNVHLASGQGSGHERLQQMYVVLQHAFQNGATLCPPALGHDFVFVGGDFNFRLNGSHNEVVEKINRLAFAELLEDDQLFVCKRHRILPFSLLNEHPITFRPTYKYRKNSHLFDLRRTPAWCDRILYSGRCAPPRTESVGGRALVECLSYQQHERYFSSDHKPVSAVFDVHVPLSLFAQEPPALGSAEAPCQTVSAAQPSLPDFSTETAGEDGEWVSPAPVFDARAALGQRGRGDDEGLAAAFDFKAKTDPPSVPPVYEATAESATRSVEAAATADQPIGNSTDLLSTARPQNDGKGETQDTAAKPPVPAVPESLASLDELMTCILKSQEESLQTDSADWMNFEMTPQGGERRERAKKDSQQQPLDLLSL